MIANTTATSTSAPLNPNGPGAAALLAAGISGFILPILAIATEKSATVKRIMNFYNPTGPLSGVTAVTIIVWLAIWIVLHWLWKRRMLTFRPIGLTALALFILGFILTFPPVADLF